MLLELSKIEKSFPGVKSLDGVDFTVRGGEVHALVGENGAGKSTLMKVLSGNYRPDGGTIRLDGEERHWRTPSDAIAAGIYIIHQELMLFPERTVAENIFLSNPPRTYLGLVDNSAMIKGARALLDSLGHHIDPRVKVRDISVADQQMVEIAKALSANARVLVLDEPTAVISNKEADLLFERIEHLRRSGVGIVYISHRLDEVFRLSDRITILKDGKLVSTVFTENIDRNGLVAMMVGRKLADIYPPARGFMRSGKPKLSVRNLKAGQRVKDVSFDLFAGEILGIGGLVGAGRSETAHAIFGSSPSDSGSVKLDGNSYEKRIPATSIRSGIGFLTEDRKGEGVLMLLDCARNISAPNLSSFASAGFIDNTKEIAVAEEEITRFRIAIPGARSMVSNLSGGNQQKVLLARWARACGNVLILDEPTRGVDIGAKVEIYNLIRELADSGVSIIIISSELNELVGLSDRVVIMREGRTMGILEASEISEEAIMALATTEIAEEAN